MIFVTTMYDLSKFNDKGHNTQRFVDSFNEIKNIMRFEHLN